MDIKSALTKFNSLAQETRLLAFRMLVQAGHGGLPAGTLSQQLEIPHNTLSFHLNHLAQAGLVDSRRQGRSIIYSANYDAMQSLISFMVKDCCSEEFASYESHPDGERAMITLKRRCKPK